MQKVLWLRTLICEAGKGPLETKVLGVIENLVVISFLPDIKLTSLW